MPEHTWRGSWNLTEEQAAAVVGGTVPPLGDHASVVCSDCGLEYQSAAVGEPCVGLGARQLSATEALARREVLA
jgi:hypothetical protein